MTTTTYTKAPPLRRTDLRQRAVLAALADAIEYAYDGRLLVRSEDLDVDVSRDGRVYHGSQYVGRVRWDHRQGSYVRVFIADRGWEDDDRTSWPEYPFAWGIDPEGV